jgi:heterodisulfide reductase subunit A
MTLSEVDHVDGEEGNFEVSVIQHPRYVDMDKCIACGLCAEKCPKKVPDNYDEGLVNRKAIYVQYAQAVPLKYAIDPEQCIYLTKGKCGACEKVCPAGAINFKDTAKKVTVNVGAIILVPGGKTYDPGDNDTFEYKKYPNIVTSLEFERILSASGPFGGHLVRPSDKKEPQKIAWIQCVGSRDENHCGNGYCSSVCCTYAVKEAMLAKEHSAGDLDTAIFYIDIRTNGKDFEQYYNRAKDEFGVRFIKSKVISAPEVRESGKHLISYVSDSGKHINEEFDLVVLSVGLQPKKESAVLAQKVGIDLNKYGYAVTHDFEPVCATKPGVYVCGAFQAPKDIPSSVIDASAAAGMAASKLSSARWSMTKTKEEPEELDVHGQTSRIGVFVCCCGTNIAGVVDVPAVVEFAKQLPGVVFAEQNLFSCSQDTQDKIAQTIKEQRLNRVVVAACTPKTHEPLFQETLTSAGINKYLFEMANIRNQCSWVHKDAPELATRKAKDMVGMAVAKAKLLEPLSEPTFAVKHAALVIGGGVAGMEAARDLSDQGFHCYLIEKTESLGGQARHLFHTWQGEDIQEYVGRLIETVSNKQNIDIFFNANITAVEGFVGNFKTTINLDGGQNIVPDSQAIILDHGVTIIASGAAEFEPDQYLYGKDSRVVTGLELQQRLVDNDSGLAGLNSAVFIQCVGSRIPERPYCSKLCCTQSITSALELKTRKPEMDVFVLYRDMRPYGLREKVYREARAAGVIFIRFNFEKEFTVETDDAGRLCVIFNDFVLSHRMRLNPDLLVLASAIVPEKENPLAQKYKISQSADGFFMEAHVKLRPVDCATDGVFICGLAHAPKPIDESITQAHAAAARAATILAMENIKGEGIVSYIDPRLCSGCLGCINVCPYGAITFNSEMNVAEVNPALCKGCGACAAACPSEAPILKGFTNHQIYAQINSALF